MATSFPISPGKLQVFPIVFADETQSSKQNCPYLVYFCGFGVIKATVWSQMIVQKSKEKVYDWDL